MGLFNEIEIKIGDTFIIDENESIPMSEWTEYIGLENDKKLGNDFIKWLDEQMEVSFKVESVVSKFVFSQQSSEEIQKKKMIVFYDEKSKELNIPCPFKEVWVFCPIENMRKIDLS